MHQPSPGKFLTFVVTASVLLATTLALGFMWALFIAPLLTTLPGDSLGKAGWYLFSFFSGLSMIALPCTLPLLFVIVPLAIGRGFPRALGTALSFGAGVTMTLSAYGFALSFIGKTGIQFFKGGEHLSGWIYIFMGIFSYVFALSELGLVNLRVLGYRGPAPHFIEERKDFVKAFLLGLFLGNIGVGSPHPATPLLLIEVMGNGNALYGLSLLFVHALGRVLPLLLIPILAVFGIPVLSRVLAYKERIMRGGGWLMLFVSGYIISFGLFTRDWVVISGQYSLFESIMKAQNYFENVLGVPLQVVSHEFPMSGSGSGILGQPLWLGNWTLLFLWLLPLWWYYAKERRRVLGTPALEIQKLEREMERAEEERRGLEITLHIPEGEQGNRVKEIELQMDGLIHERAILEEGMRYGAESGLRDKSSQHHEEESLRLRMNWYIASTLLAIVFVAYYLPLRLDVERAERVGERVLLSPVGKDVLSIPQLRWGTPKIELDARIQ